MRPSCLNSDNILLAVISNPLQTNTRVINLTHISYLSFPIKAMDIQTKTKPNPFVRVNLSPQKIMEAIVGMTRDSPKIVHEVDTLLNRRAFKIAQVAPKAHKPPKSPVHIEITSSWKEAKNKI